MSDLCLMVAPNGARRTRSDHPELPLRPEELARTARACRDAGAAAIHLHVRDAEERHTLDPDVYRAAISAVGTAVPEMAIQVTTESASLFDLSEQIASVEALRPACLSFSIAELMRDGRDRSDAFLAWAAETGIAIQFILYDAEQIGMFAALWREDALHLKERPRLIVVVGRYAATQESRPADFEALHDALKAERLTEEAIWMTCAFGSGEMACLERTISLGGHVRVGFENAIVDSRGRPAADNAERVAHVAGMARAHGRPLLDGAGAWRHLGAGTLRPLI